MGKDVAELLEQALRLPPEARAAIADSLLDSLDSEVDEGVEAAWKQEISTRLRELASGGVEGVPWDETRKRLRTRHAG